MTSLSNWRVKRNLTDEEQRHCEDSDSTERDGNLLDVSEHYVERMSYERTLVLSSHSVGWCRCVVADQTCRNIPTTMQTVAEVKNITGICHVTICSKLGVRRPVLDEWLFSPFVLEISFRMLTNPSRCDERRCSRTV